MNIKWKLLGVFVVLYLIGVVGAGWHTFDATDPARASPMVEAIKIVFIMLGGLGVILPTYLNVWQSLETAKLLQDQVQRSKIENTFKLIEKWNDKALLEARNFTRELKEQHSTLSPDQLKGKITQTPELKQSVILVLNYFDTVRVSIEHDRVVASVIENALGGVFHDIFDRFRPWIREQGKDVQQDLESLSKLLPVPKRA